MDEIVTTLPGILLRSIDLVTSARQKNTPSRSTRITRYQSSDASSDMGAELVIPAQVTRICGGPSRSQT